MRSIWIQFTTPTGPGPRKSTSIQYVWQPVTVKSIVRVTPGNVDASGAAGQINVASATLMAQRLFHTSTGVPGHGIVTVGGLAFTSAGLDNAALEGDIEVLFLSL